MESTKNNGEQERDEIWKQILESTSTMEEVARKSDWGSLNKLIESRQRLLKQFFSAPIARNHEQALDKIRNEIKLILTQDARTEQLSQRNKAAMAEGLRKLKKGKHAIQQYQ